MGNNTTRLRPEVMEDLTDTTHFTEAEIRRWYKDFQKDFPSGQVSMAQFKKIYTQHFPGGDAGKFAEHVFRTFDKDQDHVLDFREFLVAFSISSNKDPKARLAWAFNMYDIDQNGYISKTECTEIIKALDALCSSQPEAGGAAQESPAEATDRIFKDLDVDSDDRLSKEEFIQGVFQQSHLIRLMQGEGRL